MVLAHEVASDFCGGVRIFIFTAIRHRVSPELIGCHVTAYRWRSQYYFPCSADHEQDWQPYPVDPYSAICDDHTYIHTYCRESAGTGPVVLKVVPSLSGPVTVYR